MEDTQRHESLSLSGSTSRPDSIALWLNGQRGLTIAKRLAEAGHRIRALFVHGGALASKNDLFEVCPDATVVQVDGTRWADVARALTLVDPEVCIVAGFSYLIPEEVLRIPQAGFINLHAGPVPKYRGGSPLNWQMIEGEPAIGVSILRMTTGLDDGPVVASGAFEPSPASTIADVHAAAELMFGDLLLRVLENLPLAISRAKPQRSADAMYWHQRSDRDGRIDVWMQAAEEICRMVSALTRPYPGAWFTREGDVFRVFAVEDTSSKFRGAPGRIVNVGKSGPILVVRGGSIRLLEVTCEPSVRPLRNGDYVDA